ncbi:hypothetical protein KI387_021446, partial [Taxus chinensis]
MPWHRLEAHSRICRDGKIRAPGAGWRRTAEDVDTKKFAPWRRLEAHNRRCQHGIFSAYGI